MLRRQPTRLTGIVFHYLGSMDAGLVAADQHSWLERRLLLDKFQQVRPLRIGDDQAIAAPGFWDGFGEKLPRFQMPAGLARIMADGANGSRVIPPERDIDPALEFSGLHVLSAKLHV